MNVNDERLSTVQNCVGVFFCFQFQGGTLSEELTILVRGEQVSYSVQLAMHNPF